MPAASGASPPGQVSTAESDAFAARPLRPAK